MVQPRSQVLSFSLCRDGWERTLGTTFRVVIKSRGPGFFPGYYECGPRLLLLENRTKIEPNKIPNCLISLPTCCVYPAT